MDQELKTAIERVLAEKKIGIVTDPRPTDLEVFMSILPSILGGYAGKTADTRSAISSALLMAREATGQCCLLAIARPVTFCSDTSSLGIMPQGVRHPGIQGATPPGQDPTVQGVMVAQYSNAQTNGYQPAGPAASQPGAGGMVQQFPTVAAGYQGSAPPQQQQNNGGMVQQFPTQQAPQAVYGQGGGLGQPTGTGMKAVVTAMFPNDPSVHGPPAAPPPAR